eukprot:TRINITY_DN17769_c0_g1_i1.p1 TRINITY_DN17769_c0_g1~~TRINITY_DN17769_c0_g1_i1.p1  ORF type:complete len:385 (+),score=104.14 TRINITY_DN17769_c0_g1_i1:67-1221(+)
MPSPHALKRSTVAITNSSSGERAAAGFLEEQLREELGGNMVMNLMDYIKHKTDPKDSKLKPKDAFTNKEDWEGASPDPMLGVLLDRLKDVKGGGKVIIAGGDGTVAWGMQLIDTYFEDKPDREKPHVAMIPMGTGNDLSRSLGFGPGFVREKCCCCCKREHIRDIIGDVQAGKESELDRWHVKVIDRHGKVMDIQQGVMNNYLSIGFDATIAYKFDKFRRENPGLCKTRTGNKVWYTKFGCAALCGSPAVKNKIKITVDGKEVDQARIKELKNIILANIDSFAAGMRVWKPSKSKEYTPQKFNDSKLEVCGYFGSFHMGLAQGGLRSSKKVGQGGKIEIAVSAETDLDSMRLQIDGEPVPLPSGGCTIVVEPHSCPKHKILTLN